MRRYVYITFFVAFTTALWGQEHFTWVSGVVSFTSSRNVYVKFQSTKGIELGDTLYTRPEAAYLPALIVDNKSSSSTVCTPIIEQDFQKQDLLFARVEQRKAPAEKKEKPLVPSKEETKNSPEVVAPVLTPDEDEEEDPEFKERIRARVSAALSSSFSDYGELHRMRYAFSFRGENLKNSRFSTDNYITFRHTMGEWDEVKNDFARALKVYSLSVRYDIDSTSNITLGRRINPNMSSIGAVDGVQYEKRFGLLSVGGIAGFRPDYSNYSFNPDLLELGGYVALISNDPSNYHRTTLGFLEQTNHGQTDRRFVYLQHSSNPLEDLNLFGSFEVDLYEKLNSEDAHSTLRLTNLYVSMRYRVNRKLRLSLAYDNRRNIIYYESYKNFIDQLIQDETRQGLRFNVNFRPAKLITLGVNTGWRFQKSDMNKSKNLRAYLNFSRIPLVNMRASLSANFLQTNFIESQIFGIRLSRQIIKKRLDGDVYFRRVNYQYNSNETKVEQNIAGASLSLRIRKQLGLYLYYEGTFDNRDQTFHRINTRIIQRF